MEITVELSRYPLEANCKSPIIAFNMNLRALPGIEIVTSQPYITAGERER